MNLNKTRRKSIVSMLVALLLVGALMVSVQGLVGETNESNTEFTEPTEPVQTDLETPDMDVLEKLELETVPPKLEPMANPIPFQLGSGGFEWWDDPNGIMITKPAYYSDMTIVLSTTLLILNGSVTFDNVDIVIKYKAGLPFDPVTNPIFIDADALQVVGYKGELNIINGSKIFPVTPDDNYLFGVEAGASLRVENSGIYSAGWNKGIVPSPLTPPGGVQIYSDDAVIANSTIANCNPCGIYIDDCAPEITGNTIIFNGGDPLRGTFAGIYMTKDASPIITDNDISFNEGAGITTYSGLIVTTPRGSGTPLIEGNSITANNGTGLFLDGGVPRVTGNSISFNNHGIICRAIPAPAVIDNNTIAFSTYNGISLAGGLVMHPAPSGITGGSNLTIEYNTILYNGGDGISSSLSTPVIKFNDITNNAEWGVYAMGAAPTLIGNRYAANGLGNFLQEWYGGAKVYLGGNPLQGANVTVTGTNFSWQGMTDIYGRAYVGWMAEGWYQITATYPGYNQTKSGWLTDNTEVTFNW